MNCIVPLALIGLFMALVVVGTISFTHFENDDNGGEGPDAI